MTALAKKPCPPLVGADVECFLYDNNKGDVVPCVGLIPGTKKKPMKFKSMPVGYAAQEDNVMVEFNIPPVKTYHNFLEAIWKAKTATTNWLASQYPDQSYSLVFKDSNLFHPSQLASDQAQTIGCEPDFDAYVGGEVRSVLPKLDNWRGAGGHVHIGGDFQCPDFVAALFADVMIGLAANTVGLEGTPRANWYGRPGIFRPKPYGIEYRSPSGVWAGSKHTTMNVGAHAARLTKWLSTTDAKELQTVFRKVNWAEVRNSLIFDDSMTGDERAEFRGNVRAQCIEAGVPL